MDESIQYFLIPVIDSLHKVNSKNVHGWSSIILINFDYADIKFARGMFSSFWYLTLSLWYILLYVVTRYIGTKNMVHIFRIHIKSKLWGRKFTIPLYDDIIQNVTFVLLVTQCICDFNGYIKFMGVPQELHSNSEGWHYNVVIWLSNVLCVETVLRM